MFRFSSIVSAAVLLAAPALAQNAPPQFPNMTFFIASTPGPDGANYGGLEGADRHCQTLAAKAGAGARTWRAYLSTQAAGGKAAVNARDRIGKGPWVNARGVQIATSVEDLHSANNKINMENGLAENGRMIPGRPHVYNMHDILTGSTADGKAYPPGKDMTCGNWTKNGDGSAFVGHSDRMGLRDDAPSKSWNASHPSRGCSPALLRRSGSSGLLYCFAAN
ncbi:MAG: lectin [Hyphomicrobiales bacterium]|nr:lectin [Hyphomicrobiales bacterium]